jgi:hypothetical protein
MQLQYYFAERLGKKFKKINISLFLEREFLFFYPLALLTPNGLTELKKISLSNSIIISSKNLKNLFFGKFFKFSRGQILLVSYNDITEFLGKA